MGGRGAKGSKVKETSSGFGKDISKAVVGKNRAELLALLRAEDYNLKAAEADIKRYSTDIRKYNKQLKDPDNWEPYEGFTKKELENSKLYKNGAEKEKEETLMNIRIIKVALQKIGKL